MMKKALNGLKLYIAKINRKIFVMRRYKNCFDKSTKITIISNTCFAGVLYHELGLEFCSPLINTYVSCTDFVKLMNNYKYYFYECELKPADLPKNCNITYPVGQLGDILIYFPHDNDWITVKNNWKKRCKRINDNKIFFTMPDSTLDSFTGKVTKVDDITLKKFMENKLKKLYFTNNLKDVENYNDDSYVFLPFFKENPYVGNMVAYWKISGKKTWEVNNFNICDWIKKNINV